jgi:hypothetical protein
VPARNDLERPDEVLQDAVHRLAYNLQGDYTLGGLADSYYEYLIKQAHLTSMSHDQVPRSAKSCRPGMTSSGRTRYFKTPSIASRYILEYSPEACELSPFFSLCQAQSDHPFPSFP